MVTPAAGGRGPEGAPGRRKLLSLLATLIPSALILLIRPLGLTLPQAAVLAAVVCAVIWWVTEVVGKTAASLCLLSFLALSGQAPLATVFSFPLSGEFWLALCAFLFAQGIANSGLADKLLLPILERWANTWPRLLLSLIPASLAMMLLIPEPFSRLIIMASIYERYLDRIQVPAKVRSALMLGLYATVCTVNMMFFRGDIVMNNTPAAVSGHPLPADLWARWMAVPCLLLTLALTALFALLFHRDLRDFPKAEPRPICLALQRQDWVRLALVAATILLWSLERVHKIPAVFIVLAASLLMAPLRMLSLPKDLKSLPLDVMVYLTAAFSIGGSLMACGAADKLFAPFAPLLPRTFSLRYALTVTLAVMAIHMLLGSCITTLSVVVPAVLSISAVPQTEALLLLMFTAVTAHYLVGFHNVNIMLGEGRRTFTNREIFRFGLPSTLVVVVLLLTVFLGWWHLVGIL